MRKEIKKRGESGAIAITKQELKVNRLSVGEVVDVEINKISDNELKKEDKNV